MAIEKTYFTGTTGAANYAEVLSFMQANAVAYFDTIAGDAEALTISCKVGDVTALKLDFGGTNALGTFTLKNGTSFENTSTKWTSSYKFDYAKKTSNGIFLHTSGSYAWYAFISKTNAGSLAFAFVTRETNSSSNGVWQTADFANSTAFLTSKSGSVGTSEGIFSETTNLSSFGILPCGRTALVPVCFDCGTYCERLFFVPFTQFLREVCDIDVDGKKYVYNSIFALEE